VKVKVEASDKQKLFLCTVCDKRFTRKDNLDIHTGKHMGKYLYSYTCIHTLVFIIVALGLRPRATFPTSVTLTTVHHLYNVCQKFANWYNFPTNLHLKKLALVE